MLQLIITHNILNIQVHIIKHTVDNMLIVTSKIMDSIIVVHSIADNITDTITIVTAFSCNKDKLEDQHHIHNCHQDKVIMDNTTMGIANIMAIMAALVLSRVLNLMVHWVSQHYQWLFSWYHLLDSL